MVRESIANQIIEGLEDFEDSEGPFIVMYDFVRSEGKSVHHNFWRNLKRILDKLGDGRRVQLSVIECKMLRTAMAIKVLAERFNVRDVAIYKIERVET